LCDELEAQALKMAENAESTRVKTLNDQFKVSDKQFAIDSINEEVKKLEEKTSNIPPDIQQRMNSAKRCWSNYNSKKQALIIAGYSSAEAKEKMGLKAGVCTREDNAVQKMQIAYNEDIRFQLKSAQEAKTLAIEEFRTTKDTITKRVNDARAVEDKAFTSTSTDVLESLLQTHWGAKKKYYLVSLFLITIECLPLILKMIAGRTPIGEMIADERKEARRRRFIVIAEAEHERCITEAILTATQDACMKVLGSVEGRKHFAQVFSIYMMALAPTEAVDKMMKEIERQQIDVNAFIRRYPKYATVIAESWTRAIKQTSEILQGVSSTI
jgi:hypothetical protein